MGCLAAARVAFLAVPRRPTSYRSPKTAAIRPVDRQKSERPNQLLEAVGATLAAPGASRTPWAGRAVARAVRAPPRRRRASSTRSTRTRGRGRRGRRERRALPDRSARSRARLSARLDPAVETAAAARPPRAGAARDIACVPPEASGDAPRSGCRSITESAQARWPRQHWERRRRGRRERRVITAAGSAACSGGAGASSAGCPAEHTATTRPHHTRLRRGPP